MPVDVGYPPGFSYLRQGDGALVVPSGAVAVGVALNTRQRVAQADVNAGLALLPPLIGYAYRIIDCTMIAIGGAAATATSVDLVGTAATSAVRPLVIAVAALTQNTLVRMGAANAVILAGGASYTTLDANAGVYLSKQAAGSNLATATHIDVNLTYAIEIV